MSPEQAEGEPVDARSDIFSFGSLLYEMSTGRCAFHRDSKLSTLSAILKEDPKPVSTFVADVPHDFEKIVTRCLRKDPDRRWQAMADLKVSMEELKEESDSGRLTIPARPARAHNWLAIVLSAILVVAVAVGVWFWWHPGPNKRPERTLTRLTANGSSFKPVISPDGKMLAYSSVSGGANPNIWVQQVGGGKAIQVTRQGADNPAFSPDGTQIAFDCDGICEIPTLGGDPRLVTSDGWWPRYSPDGSNILFLFFSLHTVPRAGGTPAEIQPEFTPMSRPVLSPDGKYVLTLGYRKGRQERDLTRWWLISIPDGKLQEIAPPAALPNQGQASLPEVWIRSIRDSRLQWIIFSRPTGDSYNLFRTVTSTEGKTLSDAEQITFTTGAAIDASVSEGGRMAFSSGTKSTNLWSIPIDTSQGRVTGERQRLTQVEGIADGAPSLSRDGKKAAFESGSHITVKDLGAGQEAQLAVGDAPAISPDGSFVVYRVLERYWVSVRQRPSLYTVSTSGGAPRKVCQDCAGAGPRGFSSDGSRVLAQTWVGRIEMIHISTGEVKEVLSHPKHHLWNPYFSWDDKWLTFKMELDATHFRLYITPVENFAPAGESRWIPLTSGEYFDDKPQLSPDANILYFTSKLDGFPCFWAQRLNPKTKHPVGAPFAIQHLHNQQFIPGGPEPMFKMELNVARDKIVTNLDEFHSDIWMMHLEPGK